jgi:hypothetical protein
MSVPKTPVGERISSIIAALAQANTAAPIITGVVVSIIEAIRSSGGSAPTLGEFTAEIDETVEANKIRGEAELARLRAKKAAQEQK